jgi:hypothetical protein
MMCMGILVGIRILLNRHVSLISNKLSTFHYRHCEAAERLAVAIHWMRINRNSNT